MNKETIYDLIVIGGGPAGLMSAGVAAERGARVLLLEKNDAVGKKLSITGGGRCNITNAEFDVRKFLEHFPKEKQFLYSPFAQFSAEDTFTFFEKQGLPLVVEARKRVFPESQKAADVMNTMRNFATQNGVTIMASNPATELLTKENAVYAVKTKNSSVYNARYFVIAAGGMAAQFTGSSGDGFSMLAKLGHTIHEPNPHIVPLTTDAPWVHALSGETASFMSIRFMQDDKTLIKKTGKILFTHFGISGPLVLNCARDVADLLAYGEVTASINFFPDTDEKDLDTRLLKLFEQNKNKKLRNVLPELLKKKLSATLIKLLDPHLAEVPVHSITKEERKGLVKLMQDVRFPITGTRGMEYATIADGGVDLKEIDTKTMCSRVASNVYAVGDTLHINRPSGGFSLQLCWTTGYVAGSDIGRRCVN